MKLSLSEKLSEAVWYPAINVERTFVRHPNRQNSPGLIWHEKYKSSDAPIISIIIPTFDAYRGGYFPKLLGQISRQSFSQFEVVVVRGDPRQGRAINIGAALAKGRYLLTLDDDSSMPNPETFSKLVAVMEKNPEIGVAGGNNVIPEDASLFLQQVMKQIPRRSWEPVQTVIDSDLAEHPLLMMRRGIYKRVGGENELIPRGLDPYLRQEFRKAGYRVVVVPGVNYSHLPPNSFTKLIKQFYRNGKQAAFCNKFYPQWVIETPENHVKGFVEKRHFFYRVARYAVNLVKKSFRGHWIYVSSSVSYAVGYIWGYLISKEDMLD